MSKIEGCTFCASDAHNTADCPLRIKERDEFEIEFRKRGFLINRIESGNEFCYDTNGMQSAWTGWCARARKEHVDYKSRLQIVGYARKKDLVPLFDERQPDGGYIHIGLDHPTLWTEDEPHEWLMPVYADKRKTHD